MRRRKGILGKTRARHSSRGGAKPVVFRLTELASRSTPPTARGSKPDSRDDVAHPMAAFVAGVSPLEGTERVARPVKRVRPPCAATEGKASNAVHLVVNRDGARVDAYRADLPARPKVPGRGAWSPDARIDLHGARARDVSKRLALTLKECLGHRRSRLLVIHGKGLHSARGESVLATAVIECLTDARHARHVRAFATASEPLGGTGALAVDLDVASPVIAGRRV